VEERGEARTPHTPRSARGARARPRHGRTNGIAQSQALRTSLPTVTGNARARSGSFGPCL